MAAGKRIITFVNPAGIIEQRYLGDAPPEEILDSIKQLKRLAHKQLKTGQPPLVLIDVSKVKKVDVSRRMLETRIAAIKAMHQLEYQRAAVCGPLPVQIITNTLALVAGVGHKIHVFDSRPEAVKWLRKK